MKPTLLVLAAGMGSRYGGLKQMDGLGPNGETIIDYSIYDAVKAGFGKVVYIVREHFKEQMEIAVREKYRDVKCIDGEPLEFQFVTQELNKIPEGYTLNPDREKPWGTAHAVLMGAEVINEPFAVINGDDYYGKHSFQVLADWLMAHEEEKNALNQKHEDEISQKNSEIKELIDRLATEKANYEADITKMNYGDAKEMLPWNERFIKALDNYAKVYGILAADFVPCAVCDRSGSFPPLEQHCPAGHQLL